MIEKKALDVEKAVLIGVITKTQDENKLREYLEELSFLVYTAGGNVVKSFVQKVYFPNPKTFVGPGKMKQIEKYVFNNDVVTVIFDDELTPGQQANIEKLLKCKILDRTGLILDIFAQRAKTSYARNQVELAQYQYILPRLKGYGLIWKGNEVELE